MAQTHKLSESNIPEVRRRRPAKHKIEQIKTTPDEMVGSLVRIADRKGKERRKELA